MHLKTKHLHSRQIFRFPRFASGETWRSPSTGQELTIVRSRWDAEDPALQGPLFAHEYHDGSPLSLVYPELAELFEGRKFKTARRVSEDGWCRPENQVICFPIDGEKGVFDVDLVGYGPTHWLPDMISGQEILEGKIEPWRASAIWHDPEKMVSIVGLQYGWVIRSEQFARARPVYSFKPDGDLFLYQDREDDPIDAARGKALHVVESIDPREDEWSDGADDYSDLRIRVRRLRDDGSYDPNGQVIEFQQHPHHRQHASRNSPHQPVELVGQMAFDGSGVTMTLPKPLLY
ncbi:MAG TPA: hypothetical protein VL283_01535 [Candidatus Baltobacteraceae bacterium]|nr:hypothetical protein [Candidatus Baltobacteraceae bacterium]